MVPILLQILTALFYPALVFLGLRFASPRQVAILVGAFALLRLVALSAERRQAFLTGVAPTALGVGALVLATVTWNDPLGLLLLPVFVNAGLLVGFALSLRGEVPMVERFARMQVDDLSEAEQDYCRRVTIVWCLFFVLNGGAALALALLGPVSLWALYTGFLSYLLMGALFAGEYVYRHARFRRYVGAWTDPFLQSVFPPGPIENRAPGASRPSPSFPVGAEAAPVPPDLPCWPDHFPTAAIVPGVLQLDAAIERAREQGLLAHPLHAVEGLKFLAPIRPSDAIALSLEADSAGRVAFAYDRDGQIVSRGRLRPIDSDGAPPTAPQAHTKTGPPDFAASPVETLLPHGDRMVWLRRIVGHEATRTRAEVDLERTLLHLGQPGAPATLKPWAAIEWMAQCVAAHECLQRRGNDDPDSAPRIGFLLGTRRLTFLAPTIPAGVPTFVEVEQIWGGDETLGSFEAVAFDREGRILARARLSCAIPSREILATLLS